MEKEYVTARLFKNRRATDDPCTDAELKDDQQQSTEVQNNTETNSEPCESDSEQNIPVLPLRLQDVIRRALEVLGLDYKG